MRRYKVRILQIAREDMGEVYCYITLDNSKSALAMINKIVDKIDLLAQFPLIGKIVPDRELAKQEYRMLTIDYYLGFYRVFDSEVVVYRVLHGMQNYPDLLNQ